MKNTVQQLLSEGNTAQALAALRNAPALDPDDNTLVFQLAARYAANERQQHTGTLTQEDYRLEANKINAALLAVAERLEERPMDTPVPASGRNPSHTRNDAALMKNIIYFLAFIIALLAIGLLFQWYKAEPDNREPLPALLSAVSSLLLLIIAWRMDGQSGSDHSSPNRHVEQHGDKSIYIEENKGDIHIQ